VAWQQLADSEPSGEADEARRLSVEVLARVVVGRMRDDVRHVLFGASRNLIVTPPPLA